MKNLLENADNEKMLLAQIHLFSPWMILVGEVTISASFKKIHFPKISEQAPFLSPSMSILPITDPVRSV